MNEFVAIERGIPLPPPSRPGRRTPVNRYPWARMEVGDSIFLPGKSVADARYALISARCRHGFKYSVRTVEGGARIWRTA